MKISLSTLTLSDNAASPQKLTVERRRQIRFDFPIDAKNAIVSDLENGRFYISFEIGRDHISEESAAKFALSHSSQIEELLPSDISFSFDGNTAFKLLNASVSKIKTEVVGSLSITKYEFSTPTIQQY